MPFTRKQKRLFFAADHDPAIARKHGMSPTEAHKMAEEAKHTATKPPVRRKRKPMRMFSKA